MAIHADLGIKLVVNQKEINRRLALYLERSREYPLRLDLVLWSDHNKAFTTTALEMLSACSHRWRTANLHLFHDWKMDSIYKLKGKLPGRAQEAKRYGCILPWTQLTELVLTLSGASIIKNGDVRKLLSMLHNIKELYLRFNYVILEFEGGFPQFAPISLNQLRVLNVPHPAILSWFEAPSLCEIYFESFWQENNEPLDVHEQISSLIQRSSCRIRKLSTELNKEIYVGTLKDVEEVVFNCRNSLHLHFPIIDISSLPNLRHITIVCRWEEQSFDGAMDSLTMVLKSARVPTRSECSSGTPISLLERVMVEIEYKYGGYMEPVIPTELLEIADKWPVVGFRIQCV